MNFVQIIIGLGLLSWTSCETNITIVDNLISEHIENEEDSFFKTSDIVKDVNQKVQTEAEEQYSEDLANFQLEMEQQLQFQTQQTKEVQTGQYQITIQQHCNMLYDKPPERPSLLEKDCFSAKTMAEATANLIMNAAPSHPPTLQAVRNITTDCELRLGWVERVSVFRECYSEGLSSEYREILDAAHESFGASSGFEHVGDGVFERKREFQLKLNEHESKANTYFSGEDAALPPSN